MVWIYKGPTYENFVKASDFFERALIVDQNCIEALLGRARVEMAWGTTFIDENRWTHFAAAEPLLAKVLALSPNNAMAHAFLGLVQISTKRVEAGLAHSDQNRRRSDHQSTGRLR